MERLRKTEWSVNILIVALVSVLFLFGVARYDLKQEKEMYAGLRAEHHRALLRVGELSLPLIRLEWSSSTEDGFLPLQARYVFRRTATWSELRERILNVAPKPEMVEQSLLPFGDNPRGGLSSEEAMTIVEGAKRWIWVTLRFKRTDDGNIIPVATVDNEPRWVPLQELNKFIADAAMCTLGLIRSFAANPQELEGILPQLDEALVRNPIEVERLMDRRYPATCNVPEHWTYRLFTPER